MNLEGLVEKIKRIKYYESLAGEVIAKTCSKCCEVKYVNDFGNEKKGLGGRKSTCKLCEAAIKSKWHEQNREKNVTRSRKFREKNPDYHRSYRQENKEHKSETDRRWRHENPYKGVIYDQRRKARKKALIDDFTSEQMSEILKKFGGCALTGEVTEVHWDHVIPLATRHGGTTFTNMVPLRGDLNMSKQDDNLFEWFNANKQRFNLEQERFDRLINWLASANEMSVEEYRAYVYECHANPNVIDEGEAI
jgi:hypothetical protein